MRMRRFLESRRSYWPAFALVFALAFTQSITGDRLAYEEPWWEPLDRVTRVATYAAALLGVGHGWYRDRYLGSILCFAGAFGAARVPLWLAYGMYV